jgi:DNA-binding transcriptional ArsR family regulator
VLKEAGLVSERRNGTRRLYRARPEGLVELRAFLDEFWGKRLEALKREAEREGKRHGKNS